MNRVQETQCSFILQLDKEYFNISGSTEVSLSKSCQTYNIDQKDFLIEDKMLFSRERHRAVHDLSKNIFLSGGYDVTINACIDKFEIKIQEDHKHIELKSIPDQMMYHAISIAQRLGKIHIYGGNKGSTHKTIFEYDIQKNSWYTVKTELPVPPMVVYAGSRTDSAFVFDNWNYLKNTFLFDAVDQKLVNHGNACSIGGGFFWFLPIIKGNVMHM